MAQTTIGAISGVFPSRRQATLNAAIAAVSLGAQMARDADAAMLVSPPAYIGVCPVCDAHRYGDAAAPCGQCENYRRQGRLVGDVWQD